MVLRAWLLAVCLVSGQAGAASAQPSPWTSALADRPTRDTDRLIHDGIRMFACGVEPERCPEGEVAPRDLAFAQAAIRFERALSRRPGDRDLALLFAVSRGRGLPDDAERAEYMECIAAYEQVRALDPDFAPAHVAFELAILRTRVGDLTGAVAEYERVDAVRDLGPTPVVTPLAGWELVVLGLHEPIPPTGFLANWAEVSMLGGDAARAMVLFDRALSFAGPSSHAAALALWGRALAEERAGSHDGALLTACAAVDVGLPDEYPSLAAARSAVRARWGPFAGLHDEGVFFEPAYEVRAYEALGHECLSRRSASREGARGQLEQARASWRFFLLEGGSEGPWAAVAEAAEARLSRSLEAR